MNPKPIGRSSSFWLRGSAGLGFRQENFDESETRKIQPKFIVDTQAPHLARSAPRVTELTPQPTIRSSVLEPKPPRSSWQD